jgi:putative DNA primase/helicase
MLDDIGTKADVPPVDPSCILETSENNYQYLYFIDPFELNGDEEIAYYEACNLACIEAGYCDPGSSGITRVYRMPGSINTKEGRNKWQTRITQWEPDRSWALNELMAELNLKPLYKDTGVKTGDYQGKIPEGFSDCVLDYLDEHNLLGQRSGDFFDIRCPWAHEHTDGEDKAGYSPLGYGDVPLIRGFHCFHAHCRDRTATDFLAYLGQQEGAPKVGAVGITEVKASELKKCVDSLTASQRSTLLYGSLPVVHKASLPHCVKSAKGLPKEGQRATQPNVQHIVDELKVRTQLNMQTRGAEVRFTDKALASICNNPTEIMRAVVDTAQMAGITSTKDVRDIVYEHGASDPYHPFERWILKHKWDGVSRFDTLAECVDVSTEYVQIWPIYLKRWLIQCVQAVRGWRNPQQVGYVLVLAGKQGIYKTTFLRSLVPDEFFSEGVQLALKGPNHKDSVMTATKFPLVELGELETTFSKSESGAIKAFLSNPTDTYRKPYGTETEDYPRCTSFCGSVNRMDFLIDETGNRRFWPVWVKAIKSEHGIDMAQLWAEVNMWWESGQKWWLSPDEEQLRENQAEEFRTSSDAEEATQGWLDEHTMPGAAMNASTFAKLVGVVPNKQNLSLIRRLLDLKIGARRRQINHVKNAWMVPITKGHQMALKSIKNDQSTQNLSESV